MPGIQALIPEHASDLINTFKAADDQPFQKKLCLNAQIHGTVKRIVMRHKRTGLGALPQSDVYVNLTGGLSVSEPACDLAIAMAIASGVKNIPLLSDCAVFGEIGLLGEIRSVSGIEKRISEAEKLGFTKCILPYHNYTYIKASDYQLELLPVKSVLDAFQKGFSQ